MLIIYSAVARGNVVLAEYSPKAGNFIQVAHQLLTKIEVTEGQNQKQTYVADEHSFHYIVQDQIIFLCLTENSKTLKSSAVAFVFLKKVYNMFVALYGKTFVGNSPNAYELNSDFAPILQKQMEYFSREAASSKGSKLFEIEEDLDNVKGVIQDSIGKVLERGDMLENLMEHSDKMVDSSQAFRATSTQLRHKLWWNDMKFKLGALAILLVVLFLLSAWACGGLSFPNCGFSN